MERRGGAIGGAARNRDLRLARHMLDQRIADPGASHTLGHGAGIDMLARADPGKRAGGDIAEGVAAGLACRHAVGVKEFQRLGGARQGNEIALHVLARGDVQIALAEAAIEIRQHPQPIHRQDAAGNLDADHLHAGLLLAVNAEANSESGPALFVPFV